MGFSITSAPPPVDTEWAQGRTQSAKLPVELAPEKAVTPPPDLAKRGLAHHLLTESALPEDVIPGPPPAFQASLLELEGDLREMIAKITADHEGGFATTGPSTAQEAQTPEPARSGDFESDLWGAGANSATPYTE